MDTIGVLVDPDHPVFGGAAERLAARGFNVDLYPPGEPPSPETVEELSAFAVSELQPSAIAALRHADAAGVETLNGAFASTALGSRFVAHAALERVGCRVPRVWAREPPDAATRRRNRFRWPDGRRPAGGLYQEVLPTEPVRHRYYAVDDGVETHVTALRLTTRLSRQHDPVVEEADVDVERATRLRTLLDQFDARTVAVDFARVEDEWLAIDLDPAPSYLQADLERHVADALASLTTIGA